jgi:hypothetical protein
VRECCRKPLILHCAERLVVPRPPGRVASPVPATHLDMELLAVVAANPVVEGPTGLGRVRQLECLYQVGHVLAAGNVTSTIPWTAPAP